MQQISIDNDKYPVLLKNIKNPPKILYVKGDINLLNKNLIAIIGSRNSTEYGEKQAKRFAKDLCELGLGIVSGMAIGIDTIAHIETIKSGGKTVAVLGCGFDNIYPEENKQLYNLIIETGGAVVSEYPPNMQMQKRNFPLRNRIVSGLSLGTLIIEATYRSGTSITANYAWKQRRKVFCIPNSIDNKNSCGTINLLKKGAKLVTNSQEILQEFGNLENKVFVSKQLEFTKKIEGIYKNVISNKKQKNVINTKEILNTATISELYDDNTKNVINIINQYVHIDANAISRLLDIPIHIVNSTLTSLEIDGVIQSIGGGKYKIT